LATSLAADDHLLFACGRYEGIDQRVLDHAAGRMRVTEVSLGDYVLFGGEVAVLVIVEALTRLIPGVLGNAESLADESHTDGLLETPVYTKPAQWRGLEVPEVLRSGDHGKIARWRRDQALVRTATRRPDLLGLPGGASPSAGSWSTGEASVDEASVTHPKLDKRDLATLAEAGFPVSNTDVAK
jgi:tRNA (guanine37-N1)-methyltransferase